MGILLGFAPFIAFAVLNGLLGATGALTIAAAVSAALILWNLRRGLAPKLLEAGTVVLFGGLALYALAGGPTGSLFVTRLCVDTGLLVIVLASLALRRPFTLQYAREQTPREFWDRPEFLRANDVITAAWALAFAVMVAADGAVAWVPHLPAAVGIVATVAAIVGAIKFTVWYPERLRAAARR